MMKNCSKFTHSHTDTHTHTHARMHTHHTSAKRDIPRCTARCTHFERSSNRLLFVIKFPTSKFIIHTVVSLFVICSSATFCMTARLFRSLFLSFFPQMSFDTYTMPSFIRLHTSLKKTYELYAVLIFAKGK